MSFPFPRRVRDLPTLDIDSEDDFNTPQKPKTAQKDGSKNQANKENEATNSSNNTNSVFTNMRMYPKRSAELPTLESDSDEDDIMNENLNCARLNDSFILSPTKSEPDDSESGSNAFKDNINAERADALVETESKAKCAHDNNLSFVSQFDKMRLNSGNNDAPKQTPKTRQISPYSSTALASIEEHPKTDCVAAVRRVNSEPITQIQQQQKTTKTIDLETPFKSETPATTASTVEAQFATPQIRSFSVQRRPRDLCSTQSQKTRTAIDNEFRSQKVLFQTPMAISRVPLAMRLKPNDSITLSLCDTINESSVLTPSTAEKDQENVNEGGKSKKSLEGAFLETEKYDVEEKCAGAAAAPTIDAKKSSTTATTASSGKHTILHINNADYAILKKLGCGGSSSVYLAQREDNGKEYALKVVDLHGDPVVVEGYLNETKLLAKLQGNVCVVALYQYELLRKESKLYLVMEKGDSDLHKILQSYKTNLPLYVLTNFLYQMLQAVNYIHQNGVIHSDLKPANFLMVNGRLKLIDFGIASNIAIDSTSIIKFSQAGTFNYISPEALTDTSTGTSPMRSNQPKIKISTKSDVWSLGCILYLLLYKKTPFSHIKNIYAKVSAISSPTHAIEYPTLPLYYPDMLVHMAKNCLQHNPKKRPSCAELLQYPFNMLIPIHSLTVPPK